MTAPGKENEWSVLETALGEDKEKFAIISRKIYRIKSAGASSWSHLDHFTNHMGYTPLLDDPYL